MKQTGSNRKVLFDGPPSSSTSVGNVAATTCHAIAIPRAARSSIVTSLGISLVKPEAGYRRILIPLKHLKTEALKNYYYSANETIMKLYPKNKSFQIPRSVSNEECDDTWVLVLGFLLENVLSVYLVNSDMSVVAIAQQSESCSDNSCRYS